MIIREEPINADLHKAYLDLSRRTSDAHHAFMEAERKSVLEALAAEGIAPPCRVAVTYGQWTFHRGDLIASKLSFLTDILPGGNPVFHKVKKDGTASSVSDRVYNLKSITKE